MLRCPSCSRSIKLGAGQEVPVSCGSFLVAGFDVRSYRGARPVVDVGPGPAGDLDAVRRSGAVPRTPDRGAGVRVGGVADDGGAASTNLGSRSQGATSQSGRSEFTPRIDPPASAPVITVTVVIAVMSFYLIALVVWMSLHYRATVAVPPELVDDVQRPAGAVEVQRGLSPAGGGRVVPGPGAGGRRAEAAGGAGPGRAAPWSWPTRTPPCRWSTGRPTWPPWGRSGR